MWEIAEDDLARVILSGDRATRVAGERTITRRLLALQLSPLPEFGTHQPKLPTEFKNALSHFPPGDLICYTDGSYKDLTHPFWRAFGHRNEATAAAAGLVITTASANWRQEPITTFSIPDIGDHGVDSAYPAEMSAIVLARGLEARTGRRLHIHSDSKASINALQSSRSKGIEAASMLRCSARDDSVSGTNLTHIKAHAEKRKKMHLWTRHEFGNHMADRIAAGADLGGELRTHVRGQINSYVYPMPALLRYCSQKPICYIATSDGEPILRGIRPIMEQHRRDQYLHQREENSGTNIPWGTSNLSFLGSTNALRGRTVSLRASHVMMSHGLTYYGDRVERYNMHLHSTSVHLLTKCLKCQQREELNHIMLTCMEDSAINFRKTALSELNRINADARAIDPDVGTIITLIIEKAFRDGDHNMIWQGIWDEDMIRDILHSGPESFRAHNGDDRLLQKWVKQTVTSMMTSTRKAYALRTSWHTELDNLQSSKRTLPSPATSDEEPKRNRKGTRTIFTFTPTPTMRTYFTPVDTPDKGDKPTRGTLRNPDIGRQQSQQPITAFTEPCAGRPSQPVNFTNSQPVAIPTAQIQPRFYPSTNEKKDEMLQMPQVPQDPTTGLKRYRDPNVYTNTPEQDTTQVVQPYKVQRNMLQYFGRSPETAPHERDRDKDDIV